MVLGVPTWGCSSSPALKHLKPSSEYTIFPFAIFEHNLKRFDFDVNVCTDHLHHTTVFQSTLSQTSLDPVRSAYDLSTHKLSARWLCTDPSRHKQTGQDLSVEENMNKLKNLTTESQINEVDEQMLSHFLSLKTMLKFKMPNRTLLLCTNPPRT